MKIRSLLFILIMLGIVYLVIFSTVFKVKGFVISPDEFDCGKSEEVKKIVSVLGTNYFSLDNSQIEEKIKDKFFCVGSVNLSKNFPDKVKLNLNKRQGILNLIPLESSRSAEATPSAQKIATESGFLIDKEGVVFSKANFETNLQSVFYLGNLSVGQRLANNLSERVIKILDSVKRLDLNPNDAKIYSGDNFSLGVKPQITFKLSDSLDRQLASLQLIASQAKIDEREVEFLDLRFDKPVVRYAPKK